MKYNAKKWLWVSVIIIALLAVIIGYKNGYRVTSNLTLGKLGEVNMTIPLTGTDIYIDQSSKITTTKDSELVTIPFSPSKHSVIVSRTGYYPWKKDFVVPSGGELTLQPIFATQNASGLLITTSDPEYYKIRNSIIANKLPTKSAPIYSKDKTVSLWMDDNAIIINQTNPLADQINTEYKLIQPDNIISSVDFYKERNNAVIFSLKDAIYILETDKTSGQNFIPLYKGTEPAFIKVDANSIYVLDGKNLMQVVI
jgi:hypothetical protein